ncbi:MAG: DUF1294 domain-containing protein [Firmicutes bacterium]|nr:DUF1294 domain-containing protein [Bacillota bacterium]
MLNTIEIVVITLNFFTILLMFFDKRQARLHKQRISEKTLLLLAVLGGSAGIWVGMKLFRHKTKHAVFYLGIPIILALQVMLLLYFTQRG